MTVVTGADRPRLLTAAGPDYRSHLETYGALPATAGPHVLEQVQLSGLTGRGGAGFPTALKLQAVAAAAGRAIVVANGAEGEPASGKDRHLLLAAPHLVLDGIQVAALVTGANEAFVHARPDAARAVRHALQERAANHADRTPVTVVEAPSGFVAGQETAVISQLNGGPARPQFAPVRISERGVRGRPTLLQNVETLAQLALIARYGGTWFAGVGAAGATGTFLATVHQPNDSLGMAGPGGPIPAGTVWEVPHGLPLGRLLETAVTGASTTGEATPLQAVLVGGYHGSWLPLPQAAQAPLSAAGLAPFGGSLGAGVVIPLAAEACGLVATARIVNYLAAESVKQCGPCRFGLPHLATLMATLATSGGSGAGSGLVDAIRQTAGLVEGRGACHHPDGTARLVRSALHCFAADVRLHEHGRCLARIARTYGDAA